MIFEYVLFEEIISEGLIHFYLYFDVALLQLLLTLF